MIVIPTNDGTPPTMQANLLFTGDDNPHRTVGGARYLTRQNPIENPGILVTMPHKSDGIPAACGIMIPFGFLKRPKDFPVIERDGGQVLAMNTPGTVATPFYALAAGAYTLKLRANSSLAGNACAHLKVTIVTEEGATSQPTAFQEILELSVQMQTHAVRFRLTQPATVAAKIEFLNDYYDKETNEDRNAYISTLALVRDPMQEAVGQSSDSAETDVRRGAGTMGCRRRYCETQSRFAQW
jgi:hypothetical protein